ncbi:MAG: universal stress protein [Desulfocapsaceae bacterium]|nr:universal stress protein [Desulfocapsaceae bacterium]
MKEIKDIVAPIDLEGHSQKLIEYAAYMAEELNAKISFIHVVEPYPAIGEMDLGTETIKELTNMRFKHAEKYLADLATKYTNSTTEILKGEIVEEIIHFARKIDSGLIIIGTHGAKGIENFLLGSVAERVVKNAHCPTLVLNPFKL